MKRLLSLAILSAGFFTYCLNGQTPGDIPKNYLTAHFGYQSFSSGRSYPGTGSAIVFGANGYGYDFGISWSHYFYPWLGIKSGLGMGLAPATYSFFFRASDYESLYGHDISSATKDDENKNNQYISYFSMPVQASFHFPLIKGISLNADAGISINHFRDHPHELHWTFTEIPRADMSHMVEISVPENNGIEKEILIYYPVELGLSYRFKNNDMINFSVKENFGHSKYSTANYTVFINTPEESSGVITSDASYGGLELSYSVALYK